MARVQVQRVDGGKSNKLSKRELYATVCYYYPQYKLKDAQKMSARNLKLLLDTAQKQEAVKMYNLTAIAAAPHSKRQTNVKKLLGHFSKLAKG